MTLAQFDEAFASFARPWQMYLCSTSVAICLPLSLYWKSDSIVSGAIVAAAGSIATGTAYMRTIDKKTAVGATMTTSSAVSTVITPPTTTQTVEQKSGPNPIPSGPKPSGGEGVDRMG